MTKDNDNLGGLDQDDGDSFLDIEGSTGLTRFGGYVNEEWHPALSGIKATRVYREMKDNDAVIGAILYAIKMLCRQVDWKIEPKSKNPSPEAQAAADFVEECRNDMESTWQEFLSEALDMLPYGWSLFEECYKIRKGRQKFGELNSTYNDGKIGWRNFSVRAQDTLDQWEFTPNGSVIGFHQLAPPRYIRTFIPMSKLLLFRLDTTKGNPEGRSILRNAYRSWFFLKRIQEIEAIGIERDLAGLPHMQLPVEMMIKNASPDAKSTRTYYETMVRKIRQDHLMGLVTPSELDREGKPTGYKFGLVTAGGQSRQNADVVVRRYESRIAVSVLGEFVLLGTDKHGSFALADNKTDLFGVALGAVLQSLCETFTRVAIPRLCELNGIPQELAPKLTHGDIETPSLAEMVQAITQATQAGLVTPDDDLEKYVREYIGLPPRTQPEALPTYDPSTGPLNGPAWTPEQEGKLRAALGAPPAAPGTLGPDGAPIAPPVPPSPGGFGPVQEGRLLELLTAAKKRRATKRASV